MKVKPRVCAQAALLSPVETSRNCLEALKQKNQKVLHSEIDISVNAAPTGSKTKLQTLAEYFQKVTVICEIPEKVPTQDHISQLN